MRNKDMITKITEIAINDLQQILPNNKKLKCMNTIEEIFTLELKELTPNMIVERVKIKQMERGLQLCCSLILHFLQ